MTWALLKPASAHDRLVKPVNGRDRLVDVYRRYFEVLPATTEERLEQAYRLRYQVYCVEHPFEDPAENPGEMETDACDSHAVHSLLVHRPSGLPMGTTRLILPVAGQLDRCFPMQDFCHDPLIEDPERFPVEIMGEVSRFCVSKDFRRRLGDGQYGAVHDAVESQATRRGEERRIIPHITLGLIEALVRMSVENGILYWCAAMEPQFLRRLTRLGIHFDPIGPMVEHHGNRQPCYRYLPDFLAQVREERYDVWEVITAEGAHWEVLCAIASQRGRT